MTVRKNYREVAYHNWSHGFHVANSTYAMLKSAPSTFRPLEVRLHTAQSSSLFYICIAVAGHVYRSAVP